MIRIVKGLTAAAMIAGACALPHAAEAWWGGVVIAPPIVVAPPPVYYPPPAYYPPLPPYGYAPPAYGYAPPANYSPAPDQKQANLPYGSTCYAGFYTCAAPANTHVGSGCSCPGLGAPSYGTVN